MVAQELPHLLAVALDLEDTSVVVQEEGKFLASLEQDKCRDIQEEVDRAKPGQAVVD